MGWSRSVVLVSSSVKIFSVTYPLKLSMVMTPGVVGAYNNSWVDQTYGPMMLSLYCSIVVSVDK